MKNLLKTHENPIPFVHVVKRQNNVWWKSLLLYLLAIAIAFAFGAIFIAAIDKDPSVYFENIFKGAFGNKINIRGMVRIAAPLTIISLGISVAFKMKFWNIGAEGQFIMGALAAATCAIALGNTLSQPLTLIIVIVAGMIGGGIYGLLTAVLKVQWGTNETLLTLMLNYIAMYLLKYLKNVPFYKADGPILSFRVLPENSWLNEIMMGGMRYDIAIFVAVALVFALFLYNNYSKHGYEISVVGDSLNTAKYAGMNVKWIIVRTTFLSAALIGLAGALQVTGGATSHTISEGITGGMGWTGIIVAWLSKLNPLVILLVSFGLAILTKGCSVASSTLNTSTAVSDVLQGIILFTVLAIDFFVNYRLVFRTPPKEWFKKKKLVVETSANTTVDLTTESNDNKEEK